MRKTKRAMRRCLPAALLVALASCSKQSLDEESAGADNLETGCPQQPISAGDHEFALRSTNGVDYTYILSIPNGFARDEKAPLLLHWHGGNSSPEETRSVIDIDAKVSAAGMIVVYPRSPDKFWSVGDCCPALSGSPPRDETVFVRELLRDVQNKVCVDERRIYTNGFSNGGFLSHMLACKMADVFAAAAPMGSSQLIPPQECTPARPISIFMTNGTADPLAGYTIPSPLVGGLPPAESHQFWVDQNDCTGEAETFVRKGMATCKRYTQCAAADVEVAFCVVEGMGHCIPGMHKQSETNCYTKDALPFGMPSDDIDGVQMDLDFLLRFERP